MANIWTSHVILSALTASAIGIFLWTMQRKRYVKVGKISKLLFYPVKSLKAVEVTKGKCTKWGLKVNGILDRSFMIVNEEGTPVEDPTLALLTPHISDNYLIINGPNNDTLKVEITDLPSARHIITSCLIRGETFTEMDCGDEAASWFQSYLNRKDVRLIRSYRHHKYPQAGFQEEIAFHVLSQASIDDLNSRIENEKKVSVFNFRPNILATGCKPYAEDSWNYMKFKSGAELKNVILTARCLLTTNDPDTGILSQKEPLVTLRKYRIAQDLIKLVGSVPCLGTSCAVTSFGEISVGDEIFAVVGKSPKMKE